MPGNVIPDTPIIRGYDFNKGRELDGIMECMLTTGFQATALGQAIHEVNRMVSLRAAPAPRLRRACHTTQPPYMTDSPPQLWQAPAMRTAPVAPP